MWSDLLFGTAENLLLPFPAWHILPEIGVDVARFGEDFTSIHCRVGPCSVHHERHNGWDAAHTVGRLQQLCKDWAAWANLRRPASTDPVRPQQIVVKVDSDGIGGSGIVDHRGDYAFVGVSAAGTARHPDDFPNTRSELWFYTAGIADLGRVSLARLDRASLRILRRQCLAPEWQMIAGRCTVEEKEKTKDRLGASPDDADALNLAYWPAAPFTKPPVIPDPKGDPRPRAGGEAQRLGLFGKRKAE